MHWCAKIFTLVLWFIKCFTFFVPLDPHINIQSILLSSFSRPTSNTSWLLWEDVCTPMKNLNTLLQWITCLRFSHTKNVYKRETVLLISASLAPTYSTWTLVSTAISRQWIWRQHNIWYTDTLAVPVILISSLASGCSLAISLISKALYSMCLFEAPGRLLAARTVYVRVSVNGSKEPLRSSV